MIRFSSLKLTPISCTQCISMVEDLKSWLIMQDDISDTSAIEALCPEEVVADKAIVDGYVKTYVLLGRDGTKIHLYLSNDFATVFNQIHNKEYCLCYTL